MYLLEAIEKVGEKHDIEKENIDPKKKRLSLSLKKKTSEGHQRMNSKPKLPRPWQKTRPFPVNGV